LDISKFVAFAFLFIIFSPFLSAQVGVDMAIAMPREPSSSGGFQQAAYYQVFLDEGGRAFTLATIDLRNLASEPLTEFTVTFPDADVDLKYALQLFSPTNPNILDVKPVTRNVYRIKLDVPVLQQSASTVIIYYRAAGYVSQTPFAYDYDFRTIDLPFDISYSRVAISVDSNLHLKGGEVRTDYQTTFGALEASGVQSISKDAWASPEYDRQRSEIASIAQRVRTASGLVRDKRNLEAHEVFHVSGSYATESWRLYLTEILLSLIVIVLLLYAGKQFVLPSITSFMSSFSWFTPSKKKEEFNFMRVAVSGFIGAVILAIIVNLLVILFVLLDNSRFLSYGPNNVFFILLLLVAAIGFFAELFIVGNKFSWAEGVVAAFIYVGASVLIVPPSFIFTALLISLVGSRSSIF